MPPVNDNIANATVIAGLSGSIFGTNAFATTESMEPGYPNKAYNSNGTLSASHTVWYKWTAPAGIVPVGPRPAPYYVYPWSYEILFTTESDLTTFPTVVQAYLSSSYSGSFNLSELVEITPSISGSFGLWSVDERVGRNCGLSNHSALSFVATASIPASGSTPAVTGDTYFIRVDGRRNQTGSFNLSWEPIDRPGFCYSTQSQISSLGPIMWNYYLDITQTSSNAYSPFLPVGIYEILWGGKGSYVWGALEPGYWAVNPGTEFGEYASALSFSYVDSNFNSQSWVWDYGKQSSRAEAEQWAAGQNSGVWYTCGTVVSASFYDEDPGDNIENGGSPTFQVVQLFGSSSFIEALSVYNNGLINGSGSGGFAGTFAFNSTLPISIGNVTCSLLNVDGITGASPAHQIVTINPGHNNNYNFNFNASPTTQFTTANFAFSFCNTTIGTLEVPLYPILNYSHSFGASSACFNPVTGPYKQEVTVVADYTDGLYGDIDYTQGVYYTLTTSPQSLVQNASNCPLLSPQQVIASSSQFSFRTQMPNAYILEPSGTFVTQSVNVTAVWGSLSLPGYSFNFIV